MTSKTEEDAQLQALKGNFFFFYFVFKLFLKSRKSPSHLEAGTSIVNILYLYTYNTCTCFFSH